MSNIPHRLTMRKNDANKYMFPGKLHNMMEFIDQEGLESVIAWVLDGRGFMIHDDKKLVDILPQFFSQTKYRSFRRQLNMWHFQRILEGPFKGAFIHPCFLRGKKELCSYMSRQLSFDPVAFEANIAKEQLHILREQKSNNASENQNHATLAKLSIQSSILTASIQGGTTARKYVSNERTSGSLQYFQLESTQKIMKEISCPDRENSIQKFDQVLSDPHDGDIVTFAGKKFFFVECKDKSLSNSPPSPPRKLAPTTGNYHDSLIACQTKFLQDAGDMFQPNSIFRL
eukprot:CAMPEP_0117030288 /NCGR_PEP_ID=MMETSP0472-20121206/21867_1 /TAXON_ID=693140 ORGANISM="Tiarina fusus, Strain LIS" /NCGR_SAMPLE_ID=MMETSP0472 /ASSEMBLY_ACC=CAM_ASM_000603 /LENGTH=285 /DNA_ID=CAMNT_0004738305 /DNA_START=29 /DNA_END=886 /DNA_ORIENTATION=+